MNDQSIIVGTDGTGSSTAAVVWAAAEAERRGLPLRVVHAFDWDWKASQSDIGGYYIDAARAVAESIVSAARNQARSTAPGITIEANTLIGHAYPRLLEVSRGAAMLVVGNRGRGGFADLLLGSVSRRTATHASCPVVVVRGRPSADGPVAVGVDDSPAADHALASAFEIAARDGDAVIVVRSFLPVIPLWLADVRPADVLTPEQDTVERTRLDEQLAPWRSKYPQVPVEVVLTHESAAAALVSTSARARLVIVGSHRHGVVRGAVLGSAGLQLLHHADCPVLIAHEPGDGKA